MALVLRVTVPLLALVFLMAPTAAAVSLEGDLRWLQHATIEGQLWSTPEQAEYLSFVGDGPKITGLGWELRAENIQIKTFQRFEQSPNAIPFVQHELVLGGPMWKVETHEYADARVTLSLNPESTAVPGALLWSERGPAEYTLMPPQGASVEVRTVEPQTLLTIRGSSSSTQGSQDSRFSKGILTRAFEIEGAFAVRAEGDDVQGAIFGWILSVASNEGDKDTFRTGVTPVYSQLTGLHKGNRIEYALVTIQGGLVTVPSTTPTKFYTPLLGYEGTGGFPQGHYEGPWADWSESHRRDSELQMPGTVWMGAKEADTSASAARVWGQVDWAGSSDFVLGGTSVSLGVMAATVLSLGVLWWLAPRLVRWAGLGAFPLFARLRDRAFDDNPTRNRIYRLIGDKPGLTLSNIVTELGVGWGTVAYHTQILRRQGKVRDLRFLNRVCFFPVSHANVDEQLQTVLLRQPNYEEVMRIVSETPGVSQREIAIRAAHTRQYISRLVAKMERAGLVRAEPGPVGRRYFPSSEPGLPRPESTTSESPGDGLGGLPLESLMNLTPT